MLDIRLIDVEFEKLSGIRLKLISIDSMVDTLSSAYVLQRYDSGCLPNTMKKDCQSIQHLYRFCDKQKICLFSRLASLTPLSVGEVESFFTFCSFNASGEGIVSSKYRVARMRVALNFITWLWSFYQNRKKQKLDELKAAEYQFSIMEKAFRLYLSSTPRTLSERCKGLDPELRDQFMEIISPISKNDLNPWLSPKIRWRNYVFLLTIILGGNRKGESLLLKVNHFSLAGKRKYFEVLKDHDKTYPRSEAPSVKTYGRSVALNDDLAFIFEHYITVWRKLFSGSKKSLYMFLSARDGHPLALNTANAILGALIKRHPQFEGHLSPHKLRNTFQDILNESLDEKFSGSSSLNRKLQKAPLQEYAGGWAKNSSMPEHYSQGSIERRVAEFQLKIQSQFLK